MTGLYRFTIDKELHTNKPYKEAQVNYNRFTVDLKQNNTTNSLDRNRLFNALRLYLQNHEIATDWEELQNASDERLITAITIAAPFAPQEKQAILELPTLTEQCYLATTLIEMATLDIINTNPSYH